MWIKGEVGVKEDAEITVKWGWREGSVVKLEADILVGFGDILGMPVCCLSGVRLCNKCRANFLVSFLLLSNQKQELSTYTRCLHI